MAQKKQPGKPEPQKARVQPVARPAQNTPSKPFEFTDKWAVILLVAIAMIVNIRTITYEYTYDDAAFTSSGNLIDIRKGMASIPELMTHAKNYCFDKSNIGSYRPLLPVSFAIERQFTQFDSNVSHTVNLILFALLIFMLFKVLRRMFAGSSIYIPFFILLLYELHPIHIEVIASVKSRDELMAVIFTCMSILQSFKFIDDGERNQMKHLLLSGVYFLLAMLSKESPIGFVAIVPLTLYFFTNAKIKDCIISGVPYFITTCIFIGLRFAFLDKVAANASVAITENFMVGAKTLGTKLGTVLLIQLKYFMFLIFPHPLSFDYSFNQIPIVGLTDYRSIISLVIILALFAYAIMNFKKKDIFAYCILFYFLSIAITSNLLMEIGAGMGERFLFIPSLAFCIAIVFLLAKLFKADLSKLNFTTTPRMGYIIITVAVLYSGKVFAGNEDWKNNFDLFSKGVEVCPNSWRTQHCLAVEYKKMAMAETIPANQLKYADSAIAHYTKSIDIYPYKADPHGDMGAIYITLKMYDSAIVHLKRAVELNPQLSSAVANLGTVYLSEGKYADALTYYRSTIALDPGNIIAQFNLAVCYYQVQKYDSAIINFKKAIQVNPDYNEHKAFEFTSIIYNSLGQKDSAAKYHALGVQYGSGIKQQ
jgi:tetratricopeptide (TPR) repeat protein